MTAPRSKPKSTAITLARIAIAAAVAALSTACYAHGFKKGDISLGHPWTRATPGGATVGAGYVKITNSGSEADTLLGGTFEGAAAVEIHQMSMDGDKMTMRQLGDGLVIKPGETIEFTPGSYHLMFLDLSKPIAEGGDIKGTLTFAKAGAIGVEYRVEPAGAASSQDHKH